LLIEQNSRNNKYKVETTVVLREKPLQEHNTKKLQVNYAILAWIVINTIFMLFELTVFNDAADLNNSVLLVLWVSSIAGLLSMRKWGAAFVTFTLTYAFSFNAFNVIYFPNTSLLNGISAIVNAIAIAYMFSSIFANKYK
jgi:hypothetical protein